LLQRGGVPRRQRLTSTLLTSPPGSSSGGSSSCPTAVLHPSSPASPELSGTEDKFLDQAPNDDNMVQLEHIQSCRKFCVLNLQYGMGSSLLLVRSKTKFKLAIFEIFSLCFLNMEFSMIKLKLVKFFLRLRTGN
jgi:hypothetical protein